MNKSFDRFCTLLQEAYLNVCFVARLLELVFVKNCGHLPRIQIVMARSSVKLVPKVLGSEAKYFLTISIRISVTRSDDLFDFGQLLQAFGNNLFVQISHILREFL